MTTSKVGYVLALLLLPLLAACSPATSEPAATATEAATATQAPPTATQSPTPEPTATPTEVPLSFETIRNEISADFGTFYERDGSWYYDSPVGVSAGKGVEVSLTRVENEDGTVSDWITPFAHPEWPLFVLPKSTGEWQQAMRYVDVNRRAVYSRAFSLNAQANGIETGSPVPLNFINIQPTTEFIPYSRYILSAVIVSPPFEGDGSVWITVARPFDDDPNSPMILLDLSLGKNDPSEAVGRSYYFFDLSSSPDFKKFSGLLVDEESDILKLFKAGDQVVFDGIQDIFAHEVERIGSMFGSPVNIRDGFENSSESKAVISALRQRSALEFFQNRMNRILSGLFGFSLPGGR